MSSLAAMTLYLAALGSLLLPPCRAEIISDLTTSAADESRALEVKAEDFWRSFLEVAEGLHMEAHLRVYEDVEAVIASLPKENDYVREALRESLAALRRADEAVLEQATASSRLASEQLAAPAGGAGGSSFLFGGQGFLQQALRRFTGSGRFSERLLEHIGSRQASALPVLRGAAKGASGVLGDCRAASKRAFDVPKYDLYNKGVAKTPQAAKDVADRLVDAAGETRHQFMSFVTGMANSIARDVQRKDEDPARTVTRASLQSLSSSASPLGAQQQQPLVGSLIDL